MLIQHKQNGDHGMFFVPDGEEILAEMTYLRHDLRVLIIQHTGVSEELQGQNIGLQLVEGAVEYARSHQLKIVPVCSFARAVFDKKPDLRDVLMEEEF